MTEFSDNPHLQRVLREAAAEIETTTHGQLERTEWTDEATGHNCVAFLNWARVWVAYVRLPDDHPWVGKNLIGVVGDCTFSGIPEGCEDGWWLGLDCFHASDRVPWIEEMFEQHNIHFRSRGTFRNLDYVRRQCANLALQIQQERSRQAHPSWEDL